jgi:Cdc6-like AAA superfamily ATPase
MAITALRKAAMTAEQAGSPKMDLGHVEGHLRQWQMIRQDARNVELSEHERIIMELASQHSSVGTSELAHQYVAYCREHGIEPVARRTYSNYVSRLASGRFLNIAGQSRGSGGRLLRVAQS